MIYVIALNPSIDYVMEIDSFELGSTNRSKHESVLVGGKSINVSILLNNLNVESTLIGFIAGFTGEYILDQLSKFPKIKQDLSKVSGMTRINVKLKGSSETEVNGIGTSLSLGDLEHLQNQLSLFTASDLVVLTGSVANGMNYKWYVDVAKSLHERGIPFVVDIASETMLDILPFKPLLIKPNIDELKKIFNTNLITSENIMKYGKELIERGAQHCIVSMGSEGSQFFSQDLALKSNVPEGKLISSVGAGDSMVAGFIASWIKNQNPRDAYALAVSCGSATAYSSHLAEADLIYDLLKDVYVSDIKEDNL